MKKTIIGISVIAILNISAANAEDRSECMSAVNTEYLALLDIYKSGGTVPGSCNGGHLAALCSKITTCIKSGVTSSYGCSAALELCCSDTIDYNVTSTTNNVQTCSKHSWNATTSTCSTSTIYRCAPGYYGNPTTASSGCTRCSVWSGVSGDPGLSSQVYGKSNAGATAITGCYMPSGTYYDVSGKFTLTSNCQYK